MELDAAIRTVALMYIHATTVLMAASNSIGIMIVTQSFPTYKG